MPLVKLWAGHVFGTNTGNVFIDLQGEDANLNGQLRFNDTVGGMAVYQIAGSFDGQNLTLEGNHLVAPDGELLAAIKLSAQLNPKGEFAGKWEAENGAGGVFRLYPHDQSKELDSLGNEPLAQIYTARHEFGAIEIDREKIIAVAEVLQKDFPQGRVAITTYTGTEQARFLEAFKEHDFAQSKSGMVKIYVQQGDSSPINRIAMVEFGQSINLAMTQGSDEAWVLGMLEKIKSNLVMQERHYATNIRRWGVGINQGIILGVIAYLPSLPSFLSRSILLGSSIGLIVGLNLFHTKYLPHATIYLRGKPSGILAKVTPSIVSWLISATAGVVATLLATYLQGSGVKP